MIKINPLLSHTLHSAEGLKNPGNAVDDKAKNDSASKGEVVSISMEGMKKHIMSRVLGRLTGDSDDEQG
ncbi:MAG: hypothetical protein AABZ23_04250 [Deltaproteobacteria bacterium]